MLSKIAKGLLIIVLVLSSLLKLTVDVSAATITGNEQHTVEILPAPNIDYFRTFPNQSPKKHDGSFLWDSTSKNRLFCIEENVNTNGGSYDEKALDEVIKNKELRDKLCLIAYFGYYDNYLGKENANEDQQSDDYVLSQILIWDSIAKSMNVGSINTDIKEIGTYSPEEAFNKMRDIDSKVDAFKTLPKFEANDFVIKANSNLVIQDINKILSTDSFNVETSNPAVSLSVDNKLHSLNIKSNSDSTENTKITVTRKVDSNFNSGKPMVYTGGAYTQKLAKLVTGDVAIPSEEITVHQQAKASLTSLAMNAEDNSKVLPLSKKAQLKDTLTYKNLEVGKTYDVTGVLMDKSTGKPLEIDGQQVTQKAQFTPSVKDGDTAINFEFDSSSCSGKSLVAFETVSLNGVEIATDKDLNDGDQTVTVHQQAKASLTSLAMNAEDNSKVLPLSKKAKLKDTLTYKNLEVGKTYDVTGVLMDKSTGKPLEIDGQQVTQKTQFTPSVKDGDTAINFEFDSSSCSGKSLVAFETVSLNGVEIATDKDLNDGDQTVTVHQQAKTIIIPNSNDDNHSSKGTYKSLPSTGEKSNSNVYITGICIIILVGGLYLIKIRKHTHK